MSEIFGIGSELQIGKRTGEVPSIWLTLLIDDNAATHEFEQGAVEGLHMESFETGPGAQVGMGKERSVELLLTLSKKTSSLRQLEWLRFLRRERWQISYPGIGWFRQANIHYFWMSNGRKDSHSASEATQS